MHANSQSILDLESRFWQSMVDKDAALAKTMIADECLITGPQGAMLIDPAKYEEMTEEGQWRLDHYQFSDVSVIFPREDTAVIAYKVHQTGEMKGQPMDLTCADSSTWVRDGESWKCALHTETILGLPH
ncbi:nuclear transport factor 2 family protein [Novosphingobium flavum]|uniref:Nuclear transport factor 2 family protein n=1 Tax=Novosphingobium flavum TaxID=1778672 RepID=A0A7X1FNY3_9SPHN|nr:nuclear transport factor 2 family protein [Novosphingobium flavum]MBC2664276.1 nuclear transport factor 2 family protein [Novosphingobium flavum]